MTPPAALAVIDAAVEDWLASDESRVRLLAPQIALALHAAGYEIRPVGARQDPATVDALTAALAHAGLQLQPREDSAA